MTGCSKGVSIAYEGLSVVERPAEFGAIHPYEGLPLNLDVSRSAVVFFSSDADLSKIAPAWTHHLYFELVACGGRDQNFGIYDGHVFAAAPYERKSFLAGNRDRFGYKAHIPLGIDLAKRAEGNHSLDVPRLVADMHETGLCLRLGGGDMDGRHLSSNRIQLPLEIVEGIVRLRQTDSKAD
jgi:hypothetical protein